MEVGEGKLLDEPYGIFVVHSGFARKARDDIRTQADSTHRICDLKHPDPVVLSRMPTFHAAQHRVGATLQRHVQMWRHTATRSRKELEEQLVDLGRLDASESEPDVRDRVQKAGQERGKRRGDLQIPSVVADVNPGQHQFGMVPGQCTGLQNDVFHRARATRAARKPCGTEGALSITTVLYLQPTPGRTLTPIQDGRADGLQMGSIQAPIHTELKEGSLAFDRPGYRSAHRSGHMDRVVSRYDRDHTLHFGILCSPEHRRTPRYYNLGQWILAFEAPNKTPRLGIGRVRHRAGIHDTHVGQAHIFRDDPTSSLCLLPHTLGIILVSLAPERMEKNPHATRPPQRPPTSRVIVSRRRLSL